MGDTHAKCDFTMFTMAKCVCIFTNVLLLNPICMTVTTVQAVGGRVLSVLLTTRGTSLKLGYAKAHAVLQILKTHTYANTHSQHTKCYIASDKVTLLLLSLKENSRRI